MQRETVYRIEVEHPRELTKREAEDMDKNQPWRQRVSSGALDNCIDAGRAIERDGGCGGMDVCPYALNRAKSRAVG